MVKAIVILFLSSLISSCTAEGNSIFLTKGETKYFLTMSACEKEAIATFEDGARKYNAFECRKMFLGIFQLESRSY